MHLILSPKARQVIMNRSWLRSQNPIIINAENEIVVTNLSDLAEFFISVGALPKDHRWKHSFLCLGKWEQ